MFQFTPVRENFLVYFHDCTWTFVFYKLNRTWTKPQYSIYAQMWQSGGGDSHDLHKINYILIHAQKVIMYLLVGQDCQLPLCSPLPVCFIHWPICALAPSRSSNSCDTFHNIIYYFLVVQRTTRWPNPSKMNCLLDGNCHLFNWPHVSNLCLLRLQQRYRSTNSLYQLLGRIG